MIILTLIFHIYQKQSFVTSLIENFKAVRNKDAWRVHVAGISNGGFMVQRLAFESAHLIAAVSSVAGSMGTALKTIRRYKGLENKYVILVEIDPKHEGQYGLFEKLAYVGASRAITSLTIIAKRTTLERLGLVRHDAEA